MRAGAQVFPALTSAMSPTTAGGPGPEAGPRDATEEFLADPATAALAASRPLSSGGRARAALHPAGSGIQAVVALRAS